MSLWPWNATSLLQGSSPSAVVLWKALFFNHSVPVLSPIEKEGDRPVHRFLEQGEWAYVHQPDPEKDGDMPGKAGASLAHVILVGARGRDLERTMKPKGRETPFLGHPSKESTSTP